MSNYNIVVKSITKTNGGFSGQFALSDNEFLVSSDNGKTLNKASATIHSGVDTIVYDGTLRPKIAGTQGQRKDQLAVASLADGTVVQVLWTQGHRGAVAAAFMAVWNEVHGALAVGEAVEVNKTNPKGGRGASGPVMAVDSGLQAKLDSQAAQISELTATVAALLEAMKTKTTK